ncbi:40S ribosomal protein S4 [Prionailurus iriomotensis]
MFLSAVTFAKSKSKTILVKMLSQAGTGYSFNTKRSRLREKLTLLHYDPIAMVRQTPFPRGRESHSLLPLPITKMLESQVAKLLHWHLSRQLHQKNQGVSLSLLVIIPILPRLASLVTTHRLPVPNLMKAVTFPVSAISLNGVLHLDEGISIADDASIMGDQQVKTKVLFVEQKKIRSL